MAEAAIGPIGWERALMAAEKVKERLRRATRALDVAGVPYAVVGGNAVAEWVGRVDEDAVRNTKDVDVLIRRADFQAVKVALEGVGVCVPSRKGCPLVPRWAAGPSKRWRPPAAC